LRMLESRLNSLSKSKRGQPKQKTTRQLNKSRVRSMTSIIINYLNYKMSLISPGMMQLKKSLFNRLR
jgi:hypothetical protein